MKKNPFLTVMIIPHTEDGPKSLKISIYLVRVIFISLLIGLMLSYLWLYHYIFLKKQNESLKIVQSQKMNVIEDYSKDYLDLYQNIKELKQKIVVVEELEDQVRQKNGFDPTKSFFDKGNKAALEKDGMQVASNMATESAKQDLAVLNQALPEKEKSLNELISLMEDRQETLLAIPSIHPTVGRITSRFGYRRDPFNRNLKFHDGVDIANSYGTHIYATADGIVTISGYNSGYGNEIKINHGNGYETIYGHNSKLLVKKGDFVRKGQLIALMGSTGRSTGPHLHYEVRKYGKKMNPLNYFD